MRPDIACVVNKLYQNMHKSYEHHVQLLKCLLRYLKGAITHDLYIKPYCLHISACSIGWVIPMIDAQLLDFVFSLATLFYLHKLRNKRLICSSNEVSCTKHNGC